MKKAIKLKTGGKVLITVLGIATGIEIYSGLKKLGALATTSGIAGTLCIVGWSCLVLSILLLAILWEE